MGDWMTYAIRDRNGKHVGPYFTSQSKEKVEAHVFSKLDRRLYMVVRLSGPAGKRRDAVVID